MAGRVAGGLAARSLPMAAIAADRHLLFGLLALQNGLTEDHRLEAGGFGSRLKARLLLDPERPP